MLAELSMATEVSAFLAFQNFLGGRVRTLSIISRRDDRRSPFLTVCCAGDAAHFVLGINGLAYSRYPYVVPERLTVWQAAAAPESLVIILFGAGVMIPIIAAYSGFSYWMLSCKATALTYH